MNIAYISVFKDGSGYSQAAHDYVLSMDSVGISVLPKTLKLNNYQPKNLPDRFLQLEKNKFDCEVVIQHTLPSMYEYDSRFKNIGLFAWETNHLPSDWVRRLNSFTDEIWVINRQQKEACINSGVTKPIYVVNHAVDITKFQRSYEQLPQIRNVVGEDAFLFYTICEFNRRKNLESLLRAFHMEFEPWEPVELVLKVSGLTADQLSEFCKTVKSGLKKFRSVNIYKKDITITDKISEESLSRLHTTCDCYVNTSFGEAWALSCMDALGYGKGIIAPASTGFLDYLDNDCAWLVPTYEVPCFASDSLPDLYTANESWWAIDINLLRAAMREVYENKTLLKEKRSVAIAKVYDFSYEKIGNIIKDILYGKIT